ncbi:MAG: DUF1467 family protein [Pseudomonadota bacterium]
MGVVSGLVLYAVIWFMTLFVLLPVKLETQGDRGEIVPGTHAGAPANLNLKRKLFWVSIIAAAVWVVIAGVIVSGWVNLREAEWLKLIDD